MVLGTETYFANNHTTKRRKSTLRQYNTVFYVNYQFSLAQIDLINTTIFSYKKYVIALKNNTFEIIERATRQNLKGEMHIVSIKLHFYICRNHDGSRDPFPVHIKYSASMIIQSLYHAISHLMYALEKDTYVTI